MTTRDQPSQVMDLMAAFGRRNKADPLSKKPRVPDTELAASHAAGEVAFAHAQRLKANRLRPTIARTGVLTVLERASPHCLDANELFRILNQQSQHVAPGTVYRALNDLWGAGLLIRVWGEHGRARYGIKPDEQSARKDTLGCQCGERLVFIERSALREHLLSLANEAGFNIEEEPAFTISILCAGCRNGNRRGR